MASSSGARRRLVVLGRRAGAWLAVCAFAGYFALTAAGDLVPIEHFGARFLTNQSGQITSVTPDSPAWRAGIRPGDRLMAIDQRPVRNTLDWAAVYARIDERSPVPVTIVRQDRAEARAVSFRRRPEGFWGTTERRVVVLTRAVQLITLVIAGLILARVRTREAQLAAWLLATIGIYSVGLPPRMASVWRELPLAIQPLLLLPSVSKVLIGYALFAFFRVLLRRSLTDTAALVLAAPFALCAAWNVAFVWSLLYRPDWIARVTPWLTLVVAVNVMGVAAALVMVMRGYSTLLDPADRRRLRWVLTGSAVGCLAGVPTVAALWLRVDDPTMLYDMPASWQIGYTAFLILPVSFWWAVASRRLFDIGFVVGRGLRWLLARHALLIITPAAYGAFIIEAFLHDDLPLAAVLRQHAVVYAAAAAILLVIQLRRDGWLRALNRRYARASGTPLAPDASDPDAAFSDSDPRVWSVADTIASGGRVDWSREAAAAGDDGRRHLLLELQALEQLMAVHGSTVDTAAAEHEDRPTADDSPHDSRRNGGAFGRGPLLQRWGPFELRQRLGAGQRGIVYRAWDPTLEREVAVKLLDAAGLDRSAHLREARHLARVRHANVVQVYGAEMLDAIPGFWMELVHGRTLAEIVRCDGRLDAREVMRVGRAVSDALTAVHGAGLLHQDVKAENVMREPDGRLVLMDLGAASGGESPRWGTRSYMAPELHRRGLPSPQSDIYSLGVLLYYLASGTLPSRAGQRPSAPGIEMFGDEKPSMSELPGTVPAALRSAIARALAIDPSVRFSCADEMCRALATEMP